MITEMSKECISCEEGETEEFCPNSKRKCGHHCNHSYSHEECCWCGKEFVYEENIEIETGEKIGH